MSFDVGIIPPSNRTPGQIAVHLELYNRSQDICLIHNTSTEDFYFYNNRRFMKNPYIVPGKDKDVGFGKGNLQVRRYLAKTYIKRKSQELISALSKKDWDEKKKMFRQDEWGEKEERMAIRVNNRELLKTIIPQLYLGVVKRHEDEDGRGQPLPEKKRQQNISKVEDIMEELGLTDKEIGLASGEQIEQMSVEDQKKQALIDSLT